MEPARFDALARLVAAPRRRRDLLRTLAGAVVGGLWGGRLGDAAARGPCDDAHPCAGGICYQGRCRPCLPEGTRAARPDECCGKATNPAGLCCADALRRRCTASGCCSTGVCDPATKTCCGPLGGACHADRDCCSDRCDPTTRTCCVANGAACQASDECCGGGGQSETCCATGGKACGSDRDCCNGGCRAGTCCATGGQACGADGDCRPGSICPAGVCCKAPGTGCRTTGECCFGACAGGVCCLQDGFFCGSNGECCSGVCGGDGKCQANPCPAGQKRITVRGEQCCEVPPANPGLGPTCGRFYCAFGVTGTGPGGCDLWCITNVEGAGCGPDGHGGRQCCCQRLSDRSSTVCVPD